MSLGYVSFVSVCPSIHPSFYLSVWVPLFLTFRRRLPVRGSASCRDLSIFPVSDPLLPDLPNFRSLLTVSVSFHLDLGLPPGRFPSIFITATALSKKKFINDRYILYIFYKDICLHIPKIFLFIWLFGHSSVHLLIFPSLLYTPMFPSVFSLSHEVSRFHYTRPRIDPSMSPLLTETLIVIFRLPDAPSVSRFEYSLYSRFPIDYFLKELQSIVTGICHDTVPKVFRQLDTCVSVDTPPTFLPYTPSRMPMCVSYLHLATT